MATSEPQLSPYSSPAAKGRAWTYIRRALRLTCPECGVSPMFVRWHRVRSIFDWFTPLDGCPRCGFAYRREGGYFLFAHAVLSLLVGATLGGAIGVALFFGFGVGLGTVFVVCAAWFVGVTVLLVRHAKSLFIAIDHWFDPHRR